MTRWDHLSLPVLIERRGLDLDHPAVVFGAERRTYGELRDRARRVANALVGLGIEELERVAVLASNRLEFLEIELGIAAARAIMVPLNWRLRPGELANLLRGSGARAIFVEDRFVATVLALRMAGEVPDLRTVIALGDGTADLLYDELCDSASAERPARAGTLGDPHEIIYTSGTTGKPKGVVWSNGTVLFNAIEQVMDFQLGPRDSTYAIIDLYYIGGRHAFTWPILYQGGTAHIKPSSNFDAGAVLRYVAEHRISHVLWVPTMLYEILALPTIGDLDLSALKMIMCGGQPVPRETALRARELLPDTEFVQVYGLTEGGAVVTFARPEDALRKPASAGRPAQHCEVRIVGHDGRERPTGAEGEVLVRAPSVAAEYWGDPELTDLLVEDGWLHTGDMGYLDDEGYLYISGRKGDMIISGGMNIFPEEIEDVLRRHPLVADIAVIGIPDEKWGESVCAVVQPAAGATVDPDELVAFCTDRLATFKKPTTVHVVAEIPRTPSGKAKKFLLRERLAAPAHLAAAAERHS